MEIKITSVDDPRIAMFTSLTEAQLRNRLDKENGIFIAESPKVIRIALDAGYTPLAILCEEKHINGDASDIIARIDDTPVYTGTRNILSAITGYTLTRGVLCAMRRPQMPKIDDILCHARRIAVIDGVSDATNIGSIFRSAAALGIDAVVLTHASCDPLSRRAARVSMGAVFLIPWAYIDNITPTLGMYGFKTVAMALTDRSTTIDDRALRSEPRLAIILGEEGYGLDASIIESADYTVRIPMHRGVDSLNVGSAAAIAFWELTK